MRRGINRLLALVLSFAMVLTGFTFLGGAAVVNADDVDNTILTVKVVDEDGDPVEGVTPLFEAYREKDDFRLYGSDVPTDRPGLDNAGEEFTTNENGIVSFDLNDENTPFITGFGDYEDPVYYNVGLTSEDYEWTAVKLALELQEPDWVESYDYNTVVKSVDGEAYTGQVLLNVTLKDEPVDELPGIYDVYILSANEQPASGGSYKWAFYGEDDTADFSSVSKDDFYIEVKEGDSDWEESDVDFTLDLENEDFTGVVEATIPDNTDAVAKQWRFSYDGGIYDYNDELIDCPAITQAAAEPVAATEITKIDFDKTEYSADEQVTATLTGTGLDALKAEDFGLEFDGEGYGDYLAYNYGNIAVTPNEDGTSAAVTFNLSVGNKAYRFTAKNYVADSVTNNPQVFKYKAPPAKSFTKVEFNSTEFEATGGTLEATVTGENLDKATAADFGLWVPDPEYGQYGVLNDSGLTATYKAADDGLSGTVTFALPANDTESDVEYTFNIVKKPAQYYGGTPTFYAANEVTGAKTVIKVKAPAAEAPELVETSDIKAVVKSGCTWYKVYEIPWTAEQYAKDKVPPIYITYVNPPATSLMLNEEGLESAEGNKIVLGSTVAFSFENGKVTFDPMSCTSGGGTIPFKPDFDEEIENPGIGNVTADWEDAVTYGVFDAEIPTAESIYNKIAPYALDPSKPDETEAAFAWVTGASKDGREGISDYIFVTVMDNDAEGTVQHTYGEEPSWSWTGSDEDGYTAATATFTCELSDTHKETVNAEVASEVKDGKTVYTATATFEGKTYTDTKEVEIIAEKPALVITADTESIPAAGGDASWGVWGYDDDLAGVVTGEDFVVQKDGVDTDIQAVFTLGNNDDEGTVTITVPANEEATAKTWTLKYDGDFYIQSGENFKIGECPAITQEAKQTQPEDPAVDAAASAINELPAADAVTAADKEKIEAARAAYDALTDEQKAKVDPEVLKKLEDAEKALKAAEDNATTEDANTQINALPAADKVTTADKEKIEAARAAYDALTDEQKAKVDPEVLKKLEDAEKALAAAQKEEAAKKAEAKAKKVKTVTVNTKTVNAAAIDKAVKKAGGSKKYVTKIVLGKKVKTIKASSFKKYTKVTTLEVKTKKLTKKSIKKSLKGSKVKTVKVKIGKKKVNKKFVKKYKKIFTKKIAGKKAKVK